MVWRKKNVKKSDGKYTKDAVINALTIPMASQDTGGISFYNKGYMAMTSKPQCFEGFEELVATDAKAKLQEKFIVPPFSILDTKQGYWQDRKRIWISLGIKSEIGRGEAITFGISIDGRDTNDISKAYTEQGTKKAVAYKQQNALNAIMKDKNYGMAQRNNSFLDEKTQKALGCYASAGGATVDRGGASITGTSIFDPVLCELMYKWFCPVNGIVLDPFAGGSVRGIVANYLGYKYHGIDLSVAQIAANKEQAKEILQSDNCPSWYIGDSFDIDTILPDFHADFMLSCPPYHDLEQYTDDPADLSNMSWQTFKERYKTIIAKAILKVKDNRFACFVVGEIRDEKGFFKGLVPYTIECFERGGMQFYNEMILVNVIGSLPVRVTGQFNGGRKIGKMHQNVLVFYKGDTDSIARHFKEIDTDLVTNGLVE